MTLQLAMPGRVDFAVDLGTENTLIYAAGQGIVVDEPSVVAVREESRDVIAVGREAKEIVGRAPRGVRAIRPLRDGVVADLWATEAMLRALVGRVGGRWRRLGGRTVVGVPSDTTQVERSAVEQAARGAGVARVDLVDEPYAAAVGSDLRVDEPCGTMIVDVGAGTTDIALISLSGTVSTHAERVGGAALDVAIVEYLRRRHGLLVGTTTAERVKIRLGSACPLPEPESLEVTGRGLHDGRPFRVTVTDSDVRYAIGGPVDSIVRAVRTALERVPPELSGDLAERGLHLTGGGALLRGLDERLARETGLEVRLVPNPLGAVALGVGSFL